ncbi:MAG: heme-dependent oxidative N-demethylase subunit alpha family protein [Holophagaceae bacterium]
MMPYQGPIYNVNPNPEYLRAKRRELTHFGSDLFGETSLAQSLHLATKASQHLGFGAVANITELALNLEEDIAIMYQGKLEAICFCFPSSWIPRERLGQNLAQIHAPVADGQALVRASINLTNRMANVQQGSFKRYVWTLSQSKDLSQHPSKVRSNHPPSIDHLFFRLETQITAPLIHSESSLFLVKVDSIPLVELWSDPNKKTFIQNGINSMSEEVLKYKNLQEIKKVINQ